MKKVMAERQSQVDTLYADAETAKNTAEADRAAYEEKLAGAESEAQRIVQDAVVRADPPSVADALPEGVVGVLENA